MRNNVVLLGVTGGIAAYKSASLVSLLTQAGVDVRVIMTDSATRLVAPRTFQALSGNPVYTELFPQQGEAHPHIDLARQGDLLCIAPASANFIGKAANGIADDLLSTAYLAFNAPILFAPAMNGAMWQKKSVQRNVQTLFSDGVAFIGPEEGRFSCGESGVGRMAEAVQICDKIKEMLTCIKS